MRLLHRIVAFVLMLSIAAGYPLAGVATSADRPCDEASTQLGGGLHCVAAPVIVASGPLRLEPKILSARPFALSSSALAHDAPAPDTAPPKSAIPV